MDTNRLTLCHFAVQALDLLQVWQNDRLQVKMQLNKQAVIDWIYNLQVVSKNIDLNEINDKNCHPAARVGFKGGTFLGGSSSGVGLTNIVQSDKICTPPNYDHGHLAMTYTALCTLRTLGDDWSRIDRTGILGALHHLQLEDGSFQCISVGSEHDMRFLYCAVSICYMLKDWSAIDVDRACDYIRKCKSFDGAVALLPGQEGHGGSTFTAIASLVLMDRLDQVLDSEWKQELIYWCVMRQVRGMQGRPNKDEDTCYSYWIGGTLRLLHGSDSLLNNEALCKFVFHCQTQMGGFSKVIGGFPDVLHSYYSLAYLSLAQDHDEEEEGKRVLQPLNCTLGIGSKAAEFEPKVP